MEKTGEIIMEDPEITITGEPLEYGEWEDGQPMPVTYDEYEEAINVND